MSLLANAGELDFAATHWVQAALGCGLGLIVGSYLATILVRWPIGRSANRGGSLCDGCGRRLAWYELIPLASHAWLRGRCRTCGTRIADAHPLVEAACGVFGAYFFALGVPALAPLAWALVLLALFDARLLWLPDSLVATLALVCIVVPGWEIESELRHRLLGGVAGFVGLWLVGAGFRRLTGREGLGGGDPKLLGALGLWFGARGLPALMLAACAIGLCDAALRWPEGANRRDVHLPLGTYLCAATLCFAMFQPWR